MSNRVGLVLTITFAILVGTGLVCQRPARTAYHRHRLAAYLEEYLQLDTGPRLPLPVSDAIIRGYEHHRDRLVRLGYFEYREFDFPDETETEIHRRLWRRVQDRFPDNPHTQLGALDNTLQVWARPQNLRKWEAFINSLRQELADKKVESSAKR